MEFVILNNRPSLLALTKHVSDELLIRPVRRRIEKLANALPLLSFFLRECVNLPWLLIALVAQTTSRRTFARVETIFLHLPKTGGTSIKSILEQQYGDSLLKISSARQIAFSLVSNFQPKAIVLNHVSPQILNATRALSLDSFDGDFFTIVREPTKRFESGFVYGRNRSFWPRTWEREQVLRHLSKINGRIGLTKAKGVFFLRPQVDFLVFDGVERLRVLELERLKPEKLLFMDKKRILPTLNNSPSARTSRASETVEASIKQVFSRDYAAFYPDRV